jgi:sterol desaturase/sphingolipid hydroxylase (fatty acid hydroxylase superfamily)
MNIKYIQALVLATVFGLQFLLEHVFPQKKGLNDWKNERFNIAVGLLNIVLTLLPAFAMVQWLGFISDKKWGLLHLVHFSGWIEIIITIVLLDLWMYVWHQLNHTVNFLWQFHAFHHRDKKMNSTTALRFHIGELLFSYPGKALVCLLAGIHFTPLVIYECLFSASVIIHHSNIRITEKMDAVYRVFFVSPIMHRIHHSTKQKERDSNYGALFSFWDRIFRSWRIKHPANFIFGVDE